jgi:prepilin signal peptidase PulO-like enzyme (type II secretory pathway)
MMTLLGFILGLLFGSFCAALIYRLRADISIAKGRSVCPQCGVQLAWYHNIPIGSFVFLRGKCASCKKSISWRYPLIELFFGVLVGFVFWFHQFTLVENPLFFRDILIVCILGFIFLYDLLYQEIWDFSTWYVAGALFVFHTILSVVFSIHAVPSVDSMLIGSLIAGGFFAAQFFISKGKWIGQGDIGLGVLMGVLLGWEKTLGALFLAYIVGALVGVVLLLTKKKEAGSEIAFGTFLSIATVVMLFYGDVLIRWYVLLIGF